MKHMWCSALIALTDLPFFEDYPFSEFFLYISSFASGQPIKLVGNCLFPRMAKEYDCYILLNRITSHCCTLILGVYYNKIPPSFFLTMEPSLKPTQQSGEKTGGAGCPNRADRAGNQDAGGPEWRFKSLAKTVTKSAGYPMISGVGSVEPQLLFGTGIFAHTFESYVAFAW